MNKTKTLELYYKNPAVDKYHKIPMNQGLVIGHNNPEELVLQFIGNPGFDESIDDIMSATYHVCEIALSQNPDKKEEIYRRVVQAFSLIMDHFYPEMKDARKDIMTEEELKALQESVANDRS